MILQVKHLLKSNGIAFAALELDLIGEWDVFYVLFLRSIAEMTYFMLAHLFRRPLRWSISDVSAV